MISGTTMVQVLYERDVDKVKDSDFVLSLRDEFGRYDQLTVTMLESQIRFTVPKVAQLAEPFLCSCQVETTTQNTATTRTAGMQL